MEAEVVRAETVARAEAVRALAARREATTIAEVAITEVAEALAAQTEARERVQAAVERAQAAPTEAFAAQMEAVQAQTEVVAQLEAAVMHWHEAITARTEARERVDAAVAHWQEANANAARTEAFIAEAARTEAATRARELAALGRETISRIETWEEIEAQCRHCAPGDPDYACDDVIDLEPLEAPVYINTTTRQCYNEDGVIKLIEGNHPNPAPDPLTRVLWNVPNELSIRTKPPTPLV